MHNKINDLVLKILQRGRLNQQELEGKIGVRDGGINMAKNHFVREFIALSKQQTIAFADELIGPDRLIHSNTDLQEGEEIMDKADKAVFDFQVNQRIKLAEYQNPGAKIRINNDKISQLSSNEE